MGLLYLNTQAGKLKTACVILGAAVAGMSLYAHAESPWNWDKYPEVGLELGAAGYINCFHERAEAVEAGGKVIDCPHPFMEQFLVGVSFCAAIISVISLAIYCRTDDDLVQRELKPTVYNPENPII